MEDQKAPPTGTAAGEVDADTDDAAETGDASAADEGGNAGLASVVALGSAGLVPGKMRALEPVLLPHRGHARLIAGGLANIDGRLGGERGRAPGDAAGWPGPAEADPKTLAGADTGGSAIGCTLRSNRRADAGRYDRSADVKIAWIDARWAR